MQIETIRKLTGELAAKRPELASRIEKAAQILATRNVERIGMNLFRVESQTRPDSYHLVELGPRSCDCHDFVNGRAPQGFCKHIIAVVTMLKAQEQETIESKSQMFAHLVANGMPVMAALQQVNAS